MHHCQRFLWRTRSVIFRSSLIRYYKHNLKTSEISHEAELNRNVYKTLNDFSRILQKHIQNKNLVQAQEIWNTVINSGLQPTGHMYSIMIKGFFQSRKYNEVQ